MEVLFCSLRIVVFTRCILSLHIIEESAFGMLHSAKTRSHALHYILNVIIWATFPVLILGVDTMNGHWTIINWYLFNMTLIWTASNSSVIVYKFPQREQWTPMVTTYKFFFHCHEARLQLFRSPSRILITGIFCICRYFSVSIESALEGKRILNEMINKAAH